MDDCDFGVFILECVGDTLVGFGQNHKEMQTWLYTEAIFRARMCARAATAGGEGLARAQHLKRLEEKLQDVV